MEILSSKKLNDDSELQLVTWTSEAVEPGKQMYQLHLVQDGGEFTTHFPTDFENHTRDKLEKLFERIDSVEIFEKERKKG